MGRLLLAYTAKMAYQPQKRRITQPDPPFLPAIPAWRTERSRVGFMYSADCAKRRLAWLLCMPYEP